MTVTLLLATRSLHLGSSSIRRRYTTRVWSSIHHDGPCLDYARGWAWQQVLQSRRLDHRRQLRDSKEDASDDDHILLLEHSPVYTLGRGASQDHLTFLGTRRDDDDYAQSVRRRLSRTHRGPDSARLVADRRANPPSSVSLEAAVEGLVATASPVLAPNDVPIYRVDRGGEVTFHGPQQLIVYPMLDLRRAPYRPDLHWFLRQLEQVVLDTLQQYGISAVRDDANTGVWVGPNKIAALGVSASSWISSHGLALNVSPDLAFFDTSIILPCGIEGRGVTSIRRELAPTGAAVPTLQEVASVALQHMENVFQIQIDTDTISQIK